MTQLRKPTRLRAGDRVTVVSPASPFGLERPDEALEVLRGWGLDVRFGESALGQHARFDYLAGDDRARAAAFRAAWLDPEVAAVVCARGGYGVHRMLPYLDVDELAEVTKLLVGFSDITGLHDFFNRRGLVTVHGPMPGAVQQMHTPRSRDRLRALLFEPESVTDLFSPSGAKTAVSGRATGRLLGGNLSLLAAGVGTPSSLPAAGGIVILEDVDEPAYRVDRMLTQMLRAGWFDGVAGVVLGDFSDADDDDLVAAVLAERLCPLGVPMVTDAAIGHRAVNLAIPLGAPALLDADAGTLVPTETPLA